MSLEGFSGVKSLLTLSTASSLKLLEELTIMKCDELEHIVADKGHVYSPMNDSFTFPNLKKVTIKDAENLKYLFGNCLSNEKHNICIEVNLPDLKILCLHNVPNMVSICTKKYHVKALSLQDIHLSKCLQPLIYSAMDLLVDVPEREGDLSKKREKRKKEFSSWYMNLASKTKSIPSTSTAHSPPPVYQFNLKEVHITGCSQSTSLFTVSITSSLKLLETLNVQECDTLEHIITDEWPNSHGNMIVHSIFPNLKQVKVLRCNNLEYVFPAFYSKDLKSLEYVTIGSAEKMKYVFGKCHADQDHSVQSELNLPALKNLDLQLPNMLSICAENYYIKVSNIKYIRLKGCLQLPQTFIDFLVGGHRRDEDDFSRRKALSFEEKGRHPSNLQKLPNLEERPKTLLSFQNLFELKFVRCKELKFIFSASTKMSIPELRTLVISECEELVNIIEDDEENQKNPYDVHQSCFPKLRFIEVNQCKKLKYLFSISTCPKLPELLLLDVEDAAELEQVFGWKQGAPLELVIKDVLPNLIGIRLVNLPNLHTIYQGIDFQTVKARIVRNCKNIRLTSVSSSKLLHIALISNFRHFLRFHKWALELRREESKDALERDKRISEQNNSALNLVNNGEASKDAVEKDSTTQKQNISSRNLSENSETSTNVKEQLPSSNAAPSSMSEKDNLIPKLSPSTHSKMAISNLGISSSTEESKGDKVLLGEDISLNAGVQRAEVPTNDLIIKETNMEVAVTILPTTTEMNSTLSTNASANEIAEEKPSTTPVSDFTMEPMDDQEALEERRYSNETPHRVKEPTSECSPEKTSNEAIFPPSKNEMTCPRGQILVNQREASIVEDDLIRLFQIMRDDPDLKLGQPYISKTSAFKDDKLAKAFGDIESSLQMDLHQIANSEEHTCRLDNALNFLCTYYSEEECSSHGLVRGKIESLQKEIQTIISSFKKAFDTLDTFTKLKEKEKLMDEQYSNKMETAINLVSEINNTEEYMNELKEQIGRLQAELKSKEKEFEDCEVKMSCLKKKKKECVLETIGFMEEYEAVKNGKSSMEDGQTKARQEELKKLENQWPTCMTELRKNALLLEILLKQKP